MTIVHLSELHLQREDKVESGVPYEDLLDGYADTLRTLEHLRQYVAQPDLFVVTGDLVLGSRNAEVGYPRLNQLLEQWRAKFDATILLALGNGDATEPFRRIVLGQKEPNSERRHYYSQVIKDLKVIVLDCISRISIKNMIHERAGGGYNLIHIRDGQMQVRFMDITSERPTFRWEKVEWHKLRPKSGN